VKVDLSPADRLYGRRQYEGAVQLAEHAQDRRAELDVEVDPAVADGTDRGVVPQHDQSAAAAAPDAVEGLTQGCARGQAAQDVAHRGPRGGGVRRAAGVGGRLSAPLPGWWGRPGG